MYLHTVHCDVLGVPLLDFDHYNWSPLLAFDHQVLWLHSNHLARSCTLHGLMAQ